MKELTKIEKKYNVMSEQVLALARKVEAQKSPSAILENLNETKDLAKYLHEMECKGKMICN